MMKAVWSDDPVSFEARWIPAVIDNMRMMPKPEKPIPIWVGGTSDAALGAPCGSTAGTVRARPRSEAERRSSPGRLRAQRFGAEFAISLRTAWDGRDDGALEGTPARLCRWSGSVILMVEPFDPRRSPTGSARSSASPRPVRSSRNEARPRRPLSPPQSPQDRGGIGMDLVWEAEKLGFDAVWTGEAYGTDAVTPITWVLARTSRIKAGTSIMQMPARTPACAAMTALSLQALSGNRFLCGIGPSGPARSHRRVGIGDAVRPAVAAAPAITSHDYPPDHRAQERRFQSITASITTSPMPGRARPASASRCAASARATRASKSTPRRLRRPACAPRARSPTGRCRS